MRILSDYELECVVGGGDSEAAKTAKELADAAARAAAEAARQVREAMVEVVDEVADFGKHFWGLVISPHTCGANGVSSVGDDGTVTCHQHPANPGPAPSGN